MARRGRYRHYARRSRTFGRSIGGGLAGNVMDGAIVGIVQGFIPDDMLYGLADPLVAIGVGWWRKNTFLQTLGGYQLGLKIPKIFGRTNGSIAGVNSQV